MRHPSLTSRLLFSPIRSEEGVVKTVRDNFGFIGCTSDAKFGDVYFRMDDVVKPKPGKGAKSQGQLQQTTSPMVAVGAPVEFAVDLNHKTGEYRAAKVKLIPSNNTGGGSEVSQAEAGMAAAVAAPELLSFKPMWASASSTSLSDLSSSATNASKSAGSKAAGAAHGLPVLKPGGGAGGGGPSMFGPPTSFAPGGKWGGGASGGGSSASTAAAPKHNAGAQNASGSNLAAEAARAEMVATLFGAAMPGAAPSKSATASGGRANAASSGASGVQPGTQHQRGGGPRGNSGNGASLTGAPLASSLETGVVITLKEAFGFIRCTSAPRYGDVFFRFEQASMFDPKVHSSIADVLPPGTEVEFAVEANATRSGEYRALRVHFPGAGAAAASQAPRLVGSSNASASDASAGNDNKKAKKKGKATSGDGNAGCHSASGNGDRGGVKPGDSSGGYTAFHDTRSMLGWLAKRAEEPPGSMLLKLSNFSRPLDDICGRTNLAHDVIRGVLALLAGPGVRKSIMREKADALLLRVLQSPLARHPSNLGTYLRAMPAAPGGPSVCTDGFSCAAAVLDEWLTRFPEEAGLHLPWDNLRAAVRSASLPMALEEQLATIMHRVAQAQPQPPGQGTLNTASAGLGLPDDLLDDDTSRASSPSGGTPSSHVDFRHMPVFPSADEILSSADGPSELRPNIVDGHYDSALQYLDTHFRLLREDCLAPLRGGVRAYLSGEASPDVRVYPSCQLVGLHCGRDGVFYRVSFKLPPGTSVSWERSKRLMYGSLLLLSADGFQGSSLLWATVANRDPALCSSRGGLVDIRFPDGHEARFAPGVVYTMVESAATYFEAYRHVLAALQSVASDPAGLPFADTLLRCKLAVDPPAYLRRPGADKYVLPEIFPDLERQTGRTAIHLLQDWPQPGEPGCSVTSSLDGSQLAAVKLALTRQVALIQGPPGTGKTFVGLKVVHTLLHNYRARVAMGAPKPLLVVTMTNHALDQFLEGILDFEPNIIRVGARSRSDRLASCNLRDRAFEAGRADAVSSQARKALMGRMRDLEKVISNLVADLNSREVTVEELESVAGWEALASLRAGGPPGSTFLPDDAKLRTWLQPVQDAAATAHKAAADALAAKESALDAISGPPTAKKQIAQPVKVKGGAFGRTAAHGGAVSADNSNVDGASDEEEEEEALDVDASGRVINAAVRERMLDDDAPLGGAAAAVLSLAKLTLADDEEEDSEADGENHLDDAALLATEDVWSLSPKARARLYALWKAAACTDAAAELADACTRYERLARERKELDDANQLAAMAGAAVIGMTTTGLAKYQKLVGALECEVVVVEEAAEVLEAHIVAALGKGTQHLILIGDHLQLRPGTAVYALAKRYNLDVSMFERLVRNGVEHVTLARQRRMRPAIARLLTPVYPALHDHPDVEKYPMVPGMAAPLWFFSHAHAESFDPETRSRSNSFEAGMTHALAVHLLRSGVPAARMTVLTTYCGQLFSLRKKFRAAGGEQGLDEIRLCSVDQYQGEENDVILLSLVRSNTSGDIGFLSVQNRMVVALSRARHGMYILGNAELLSKRNALWRGVVDHLAGSNCVAEALPCLAGPRPGSQKAVHVANIADFGQCMAAGYPPRGTKTSKGP